MRTYFFAGVKKLGSKNWCQACDSAILQLLPKSAMKGLPYPENWKNWCQACDSAILRFAILRLQPAERILMRYDNRDLVASRFKPIWTTDLSYYPKRISYPERLALSGCWR